MELDLSNFHFRNWNWTLAFLTLVVLAGLMLFGKAVTPPAPGVLSWSEWQVRKLRIEYQQERQQLRQDLRDLAGLLADAQPDPARAQIIVQRVRRHLEEGSVEALADERELISLAAHSVLAWSSGMSPYNQAVDAVTSAEEALDAAER